MIVRIALASLVIAALGLSHAALYWHTREKWHDLGRNTGVIQGQLDVLEALTPFATPGAPPSPPAVTVGAKTTALYLVADGDGYRLYVQP